MARLTTERAPSRQSAALLSLRCRTRRREPPTLGGGSRPDEQFGLTQRPSGRRGTEPGARELRLASSDRRVLSGDPTAWDRRRRPPDQPKQWRGSRSCCCGFLGHTRRGDAIPAGAAKENEYRCPRTRRTFAMCRFPKCFRASFWRDVLSLGW